MKKQSFSQRIAGPIGIAIFYLLVSWFCFILLFTIVTSAVLMQQGESGQVNQVINDISVQYLFVAYAIGALFTLFVCWMGDRAFARQTPFWISSGWFWELEPVSIREFWRGAGSGILLPAIAIALLTSAGQINFLGTFITSGTSSPIFFLFLLNALSLAVMVLCEEYIFRHKILGTLTTRISPLKSVIFTSIGYVAVKYYQFSLAPVDYVTLFLASASASFYFLRSGRIFRSLGFLGTLYGVIHFVCGLNLWGHSTAGLFLFTDAKSASALVTGGLDGPLAGTAMLSLMLITTIVAYLSWKKGNEGAANSL